MKLKTLFNCGKSAIREKKTSGEVRLLYLVMILLITSFVDLSASNDSIKITYNGDQVSLETVFKEIKKQTGYSVVCTAELLKKSKPVTVKAVDMSLENFLQKILSGQSLEYTIENTTIFISLKESGENGKIVTAQVLPKVKNGYKFTLTGRIIDSSGEPIPGVSIAEQELGRGTASDGNGDFSMTVMDGDIIQISSIGFLGLAVEVRKSDFEPLKTSVVSVDQPNEINDSKSRGKFEKNNGLPITSTVKISSDELSKEMLVFTLVSKIENLLEVTVNAGYYKVKQRVATGNIASVDAKTIENQPVGSVLQALEGAMPGLFIEQNSGLPGAGMKVKIRGANSVSAGSIPLYIIDGVPFNGASVDAQNSSATRMSGTPNSSIDPFSMLNPNDIESIDVLKDADATAIYGSRGANGVVLITTKKGKSGKPKFSVNASTGTGRITRFLPTLSTAEYLNLRKQAFENDGIEPDEYSAPDLVSWDQSSDVDYQKKLIGNSASLTDVSGSLSGGSGGTNFLLSGTFHRETPVTPGSSRYIRGSLNMNINYVSPEGKLKTSLSTIYSADDNLIYGTDYTSSAYQLPGNYPAYDSNGDLYYDFNFSNPFALLKQSFNSKSSNLVLNANVNYAITSDIEAKLSVGVNKVELDQTMLYPSDIYNPAYEAPDMGFYTSNSSRIYIAEPQINYNKQIGGGKLSGVVGGTWQGTYYNQPYFVIAADFASQSLMKNYSSASSIYMNTSTSAEYKYVSLFGQVNYNWEDKYIFNGTFRRDGSSKFGPDKRFGNFGSLGAAWIFTEEEFLKNCNWLSYGKLRSSYGVTGNDQIGNYGYLDTYTSSAYSYGNSKGFVSSGIANSDYSWEKSNKLEVATELGFLNDKLMLSVAWYRNRSTNLLVDYPLSTQTGFSSYMANLDAVVQNTGIEAEINARPVSTENFKWKLNFNFSTYKNKLVEYPDLSSSSYADTYVVGKSLNLAVGYHFTGFENGAATVEDANGDGVISPGIYENELGDYKVLGSLDPKFYGGISNSFTYKRWQLDILFNFVNKKGYQLTGFPGMLGNIPDYSLNTGFTPSTDYSSESYMSYTNYYMQSDAIFKDASFVRLRNLSISYSLPDRWTSRLKISDCRFYAKGQNLFTITSYKGYDPETPGTYSVTWGYFSPAMPPLRVFSLGIDVTI